MASYRPVFQKTGIYQLKKLHFAQILYYIDWLRPREEMSNKYRVTNIPPKFPRRHSREEEVALNEVSSRYSVEKGGKASTKYERARGQTFENNEKKYLNVSGDTASRNRRHSDVGFMSSKYSPRRFFEDEENNVDMPAFSFASTANKSVRKSPSLDPRMNTADADATIHLMDQPGQSHISGMSRKMSLPGQVSGFASERGVGEKRRNSKPVEFIVETDESNEPVPHGSQLGTTGSRFIAPEEEEGNINEISKLLDEFEQNPAFDISGALANIEKENEEIDKQLFAVVDDKGKLAKKDIKMDAFAETYVLDESERDKYSVREQALRDKISELRERLNEANDEIGSVTKQKENLEMETELLVAEKERMEFSQYKSLAPLGATTAEREREKQEKEEEEARLKRETAKRIAVESGLMMELAEDDIFADHDEALSHLKKGKVRHYFRRWRRRFAQIFRNWLPLERDVTKVESRFGEGIGAYFRFYRWIVVQFLMLALLVGLVSITHIILAFARDPIAASRIIIFFPSFMHYSSFTGESVTYSVMLLIGVLVLIIVLLQRVVWEHRKARFIDVEKEKTENKFSKMSLCIWPFGISNDRVAEDFRNKVADDLLVLLTETEINTKVKTRTRSDKTYLFLRRFFGFFVVSLLIATGWTVIIALTVLESSIRAVAQNNPIATGFSAFIVPIAVTFINLILPPVIKALTAFERWDNPGFALRFQVARLYLTKILNILIILFGYYELVSGNILIPGTAQSSVPGVCVEDLVASGLLSLLLTDFFIQKFASLGVIFVRKFANYLRSKPVGRLEFNLSGHVIDLIYSVSLVLALFPYMPYVMVVALILNILTFKWNVWILGRYHGRPVNPWRARDTGIFFLFFYGASFVLFLICDYFFLVSLNHSGCATGPYSGTMLNWILGLKEYLWGNWGLWVISSPEVMWSLIVVILLQYYFKKNQFGAFQGFYISKDLGYMREKEALEKLIKKQARIIDHQKKLREVESKMQLPVISIKHDRVKQDKAGGVSSVMAPTVAADTVAPADSPAAPILNIVPPTSDVDSATKV